MHVCLFVCVHVCVCMCLVFVFVPVFVCVCVYPGKGEAVDALLPRASEREWIGATNGGGGSEHRGKCWALISF